MRYVFEYHFDEDLYVEEFVSFRNLMMQKIEMSSNWMKYEADVKHKTDLEFILFVAKYSASCSGKYVIV